MAKLELICVGDLKFPALKELEAHYLKRIAHFSKLSTRVIKDFKIKEEEQKKKKEGEAMMALVEPRDFVVALDEKGKNLSSLEFARFLDQKLSYHPGRTLFLVGGHAGLHPQVLHRADYKLSFSPMTFAHDMFRIIFLEQLYRAFTINKGITYHR